MELLLDSMFCIIKYYRQVLKVLQSKEKLLYLCLNRVVATDMTISGINCISLDLSQWDDKSGLPNYLNKQCIYFLLDWKSYLTAIMTGLYLGIILCIYKIAEKVCFLSVSSFCPIPDIAKVDAFPDGKLQAELWRNRKLKKTSSWMLCWL